MSPKLFLALALVTLITTAAAVGLTLERPTAGPVHYVDEPAFPALRANPDAVAKIVVTTPEGSFSLVRETGDRWAALERFGYAVDPAKVRRLIVSLADMRLIEPKTSRAERYARLEVEDVDAEDAKSRLVRLESADGNVLAEAIIGKQHHRLTGSASAGTYLRRPGEAQSWLASGGIGVEEQVTGWLDDQIVDLDPERIGRVQIEPRAGPPYTVVRAAPGEEMRLATLAEGEAAKADADPNRLARAFSGMRFEDVRPRSEIAWPEANGRVRASTFDGVELTVRLAEIGEERWALLDARAIEPIAVSADESEPSAAAGSTEGERGPPASEAGSGDAASATGNDAAEDAPPEPPDAAALQERLGQWAYRISPSLFDRLTPPRSDFVAPDGTS